MIWKYLRQSRLLSQLGQMCLFRRRNTLSVVRFRFGRQAPMRAIINSATSKKAFVSCMLLIASIFLSDAMSIRQAYFLIIVKKLLRKLKQCRKMIYNREIVEEDNISKFSRQFPCSLFSFLFKKFFFIRQLIKSAISLGSLHWDGRENGITTWNFMKGLFLVLVLVEIGWLCTGVTWLARYYQTCPVDQAKDVMLGKFCIWELHTFLHNIEYKNL